MTFNLDACSFCLSRALSRAQLRTPFLVVLGLVVLSAADSAVAQERSVVVRGAPDAKAADLEKVRDGLGARLGEKVDVKGAEVWVVPERKLQQAVQNKAWPIQSIESTTTPLNNLFLSMPAADLQPQQTQALVALRRDKSKVATQIVRIEAAQFKRDLLRDARQTMTLALTDDRKVQAKPEKVDERQPQDFTWYGTVAPAPGVGAGDAVLVVRGANVTGTVRVGTDVYVIKPIGGGIHAVSRLDRKALPPDEPPGFDEKKPGAERRGDARQQQAGAQVAGTPQIDVLVAYTPAVAAAVADVEGLIQLAVDETNQSYLNSKIAIDLHLAKTAGVQYVESGSVETDVDRLTATGDGFLEELHALRDQSQADVVVLLVDDGAYCGIASDIAVTEERAFAVVYHGCATGYYSFGHEIGHLQGARHDRCVDDEEAPYPYGHCHTEGNDWRTIMAYGDCCGGCDRIQYWSNPSVSYLGKPTGREDEDNARVLNETAGATSSFRPRQIGRPTPPAIQQ